MSIASRPYNSADLPVADVSPSPARTRRRYVPWLLLAALGLLIVAGFAGGVHRLVVPHAVEQVPLKATVRKSTVPILVTAGGELESAVALDVVCQLEGQQHKIIEMLPEGSHVTEGQVVLRLDSSAITDRLAQQQIKVTQVEAVAKAAAEDLKIKKNLAASQIAQADLAVKLAELDKRKFIEGEYLADHSELQGKIALAKARLQDAQDTLEFYRTLVKKGFRTPEQLRAKEQEVQQAEYELRGHETRLSVLENFTKIRQEAELTAKADEFQRDLERARSSAQATLTKAESDLAVAEATLRMERQLLQRIEKQLGYCDVAAVTEGTLVYAKDQNKKIELGGTVHYKQRLFSVPDMTKMQVRAFVHESEIKKLSSGLPAEVRVDALPNRVMRGKVVDVSTFYDGTRHWLSGGVKEYATLITIEDSIDGSLKPGMTSQVSILVGELKDSLLVPITAVAEKDGRYFCFSVDDRGVTPRAVAIGNHTDSLVEVQSGLEEGEQVTLDARRRVEGLSGNQREATPQPDRKPGVPVASAG